MGSAQGAGTSSVGCESVPGVIISPQLAGSNSHGGERNGQWGFDQIS